MSLLAQLYNKPAWVRYGAIVDFDFVNQRYYGGNMGLDSGNSASTRMKTAISCGGNSTANSLYAPNSNQLLSTFPSNAALLTDLGLWIQNTSNTNYCGFCRNLTGAGWVLGGSMAVTNTSISGADGKSSGASRITAGANNDTILFAITQASASFTSGCYLRRKTGTGVINMTTDGGSTWTRVDNTSGFNSSTYIRVQVPAQTLANPSVGLQIVTANDAVDVDFVMCANNIDGVTQLATPILTPTASSVSRIGCAGFFNNPSTAAGFNDGWRWINGFLSQGPCSAVVECSGNGSSNCLLIGTDFGFLFSGGCDGGPVALGGAGTGTGVTSTNNGTSGLGNINKAGFSLGGGKGIVALNGITTQNTTTHFSTTASTHGGIGSHNNTATNANNINGYFRRMTLFPRDITEGELINYTT